jgi:hypothetical protein
VLPLKDPTSDMAVIARCFVIWSNLLVKLGICTHSPPLCFVSVVVKEVPPRRRTGTTAGCASVHGFHMLSCWLLLCPGCAAYACREGSTLISKVHVNRRTRTPSGCTCWTCWHLLTLLLLTFSVCSALPSLHCQCACRDSSALVTTKRKTGTRPGIASADVPCAVLLCVLAGMAAPW